MAKGGGTADADRPQSRRKANADAAAEARDPSTSRRKDKGTAASASDPTRNRHKRKGGAAEASDRSKSRRKGKGAVEDAVRPRPFLDRRRIITYAVGLALIILVLFVTQKDGGNPQGSSFASQPSASVTTWTYTAHAPGGDTQVLCSDDDAPCDPDTLWRHHSAGATCELDLRVWLASAELPVVLRGVKGVVNVTAWAGDYTVTDNATTPSNASSPINITTTHIEKPLAWDNGWWWRVESEHVRVPVQVPCDTHSASIVLRLSASHLDGDPWSQAQQTRVTLHDEYLAALGKQPGSPFTA